MPQPRTVLTNSILDGVDDRCVRERARFDSSAATKPTAETAKVASLFSLMTPNASALGPMIPATGLFCGVDCGVYLSMKLALTVKPSWLVIVVI
jgi:hypothetical protein